MAARPDLQTWSPRNVFEAEGTLVFLLSVGARGDAATLRALHRDVVLDGGVTLLSPVLPAVGTPVEVVVAHPATGTLGSVAGVVVAREATLPMVVHVRVSWSPAARAAFEGWVDSGVSPSAPEPVATPAATPVATPVLTTALTPVLTPVLTPIHGRGGAPVDQPGASGRAPGTIRLVDDDDITIDLFDDGEVEVDVELDAAFAAVSGALGSAEGAAE